MNTFLEFVNYLKKINIYPSFDVIESGVNEPVCTIRGEKYLLFCSNNYLGLTQNNKVKQAAINSIMKYGVGPGGSRVLSGNVEIIEDLEKIISKLVGKESTIAMPTGYMANVGVFSALMDSGIGEMVGYKNFNSGSAAIFSDEFNHGSIVDGCRLSNANKVIFRHNDLFDLENKLKESDVDRKLIITEGVFSLEGEITPIPEYIKLAKKYNSLLMVDDAHGIGLLGENGGGVAEHFHCSQGIDIIMGCMDKALGGTGGFLSGDKGLIDYLKISLRSSLLSSALPTVTAGAMIEAIKQVKENNVKRVKTFELANRVRKGLARMGLKTLGKDSIPAVSLYIGDEIIGIQLQREIFMDKIFCQLVRWPAVPSGTARFRIVTMADHTEKQVDQLLASIEKGAKKIKII